MSSFLKPFCNYLPKHWILYLTVEGETYTYHFMTLAHIINIIFWKYIGYIAYNKININKKNIWIYSSSKVSL